MQNSGSESTRITASYCDCGLKNETLGAVQISAMSWQASSHNSNCIAALVKPHPFPLPFSLCAGVCVGVGDTQRSEVNFKCGSSDPSTLPFETESLSGSRLDN